MTTPSNSHINIAFVLSYVGTPFRGSQLQMHEHPFSTLEGLLLVALNKVNLINIDLLHTHDNSKNSSNKQQQQSFKAGLPPHLHLGRASRTDKGVSAMCNVVNLHVKEFVWKSFPSSEDACRAVNRAIEEITASGSGVDNAATVAANSVPLLVVQSAQPVSAMFSGRFCANRRVYRYLIPAFALDPPNSSMNAPLPGSWVFEADASSEAGAAAADDDDESGLLRFRRAVDPAAPQWKPKHEASGEQAEDAAQRQLQQREEILNAVQHFRSRAAIANDMLSRHFVGNHRFHNFTGPERRDSMVDAGIYNARTVHACDDEAVRRILRCQVLPEPLLLPVGVVAAAGTRQRTTLFAPYYLFQIDGASFLLHMIRKIVGVLVAVVRGLVRESIIEDALSSDKIVNTPMAPSRYLALTRVFFERYDQSRPADSHFPSLSETIRSVERNMEQFEQLGIFAEMARLDSAGTSIYSHFDSHANDTELMQDDKKKSNNQKRREQAAAGNALAGKSAESVVTNEMRRFLRLTALHNWAVAENPPQYRPVVGATHAKKQERKQRAREEAAAAATATAAALSDEQSGQRRQREDKLREKQEDQEQGQEDNNNDEGGYDEDDDDDDEENNATNPTNNATATSTTVATQKKKPLDNVSAWVTLEHMQRRNREQAARR